jgi:hypothetical protein
VISAGIFAQRVDGYAGAPQTVYSDHFLHTEPIDGPIGYKLEAPPLHPLLLATTMSGSAPSTRPMMRSSPCARLLALLRDGFTGCPAAAWRWARAPVLDYPSATSSGTARGAPADHGRDPVCRRRETVTPVHEQALAYSSWAQAQPASRPCP